MNAFFRFAAAALVGGFTSAAAAGQPGPHVVGSGENASVEYTSPSQNIVGGALYRTSGSGESASMQTTFVQDMQEGGGIAHVVGSGENLSVVYGPAPAPMQASAGRGTRG